MKKIPLVIAFCIVGSNTYAQELGNYKYVDKYRTDFYSPILWGPNGFRTVEQENQLMADLIAERRRRSQLEDSSPEERSIAKQRHDQEVAAKKQEFDAKKKKTK